MLVKFKSVPLPEELRELEAKLGEISGITQVITWPAAENNQPWVVVELDNGVKEEDVAPKAEQVVKEMGL